RHDGVELLFFGTPGQARFDFMWRILSEGADGCVLLVDASSAESIAEAADILAAFRERHPGLPVVVGAGRTESGVRGLVQVARLAATLGVPRTQVIAVDARDANRCRALLLALLVEVFEHIESALAAPSAVEEADDTVETDRMPVAV
ncbi:MAG: hypothetical protein ACRCY8_02625, partial [Dermatophilaceae bacterium]